jgi:hypothetical protein
MLVPVAGTGRSAISQGRVLPLPGTELVLERQRSRRWTAMVVLAAMCTVGLLALFRLTPADGMGGGPSSQSGSQSGQFQPQLFQNWGKPLLAIVLTGEEHGYMEPCGCSEPQYGGMLRRYNFMESLRNKGWPLVALDLGDVAQKEPNPQQYVKYRYSMQALKLLGYAAMGVGELELSMPLQKAIGEFRLNNGTPKLLAATIKAVPKNNAFIKQHVDDQDILAPQNAPTVGVIGLTGTGVINNVNKMMKNFPPGAQLNFGDNVPVLRQQLADLKKAKTQINILLYQGIEQDAIALAQFCDAECKKNADLAPVDIILYLAPDPEPPSIPLPGVKNAQGQPIPTLLINMGHKGRYVGVVGVFPGGLNGAPYTFKYQLRHMDPGLDTPEAQKKDHPVMKLLEQYTFEVKNGEYITKFPTWQHRVQTSLPKAKYVGSERCEGCHPAAFKVWQKSDHAKAFQGLVNAKFPSQRQHDGECIKCHVTGFDHPTGYGDALRQKDVVLAKKLEAVGCESCHGPGSEHVKDTKNVDIHKQMNLWHFIPQGAWKIQVNKFCITCHDVDNDVHWNFKRNWDQIAHPSPNKNGAAQPAGPANLTPAKPQPATAPPTPTAPPGSILEPPTALPPSDTGTIVPNKKSGS